MIKTISNVNQANALLTLARNTKMNCWFGIKVNNNDKLVCVDYEDESRVISARKAVKDLLDGATHEDLNELSHNDLLSIVDCLQDLL